VRKLLEDSRLNEKAEGREGKEGKAIIAAIEVLT